jgi:DNA polymerase-3 subunit delta
VPKVAQKEAKTMILTLVGPNTFLVQQELNRLVADFVKAHGDLALERLDGEETSYEKIAESLQSLPFLASRKLVVLRCPSASEEFTEKFEQLIKNIPEGTSVILVEPKPDKRTAFYKLLKKTTDFNEYGELGERELPNWLVEQAGLQGGTLKLGDANYLVQRVGADQQLLSSELGKLLSYNPAITRSSIDLLTEPAPQSSVFELLDAAFAGNTKRTLDLYKEQRAQKVEPQQIMAMIAWQLHILAVVKTAGERGTDEIAKEASLNPYVVRKSMQTAKKITYKNLKTLIHEAFLLDVSMKSQNIDADDALQQFLLSLSTTS